MAHVVSAILERRKLIAEADRLVQLGDGARRREESVRYLLQAAAIYEQVDLPVTAKLCRKHAAER